MTRSSTSQRKTQKNGNSAAATQRFFQDQWHRIRPYQFEGLQHVYSIPSTEFVGTAPIEFCIKKKKNPSHAFKQVSITQQARQAPKSHLLNWNGFQWFSDGYEKGSLDQNTRKVVKSQSQVLRKRNKSAIILALDKSCHTTNHKDYKSIWWEWGKVVKIHLPTTLLLGYFTHRQQRSKATTGFHSQRWPLANQRTPLDVNRSLWGHWILELWN